MKKEINKDIGLVSGSGICIDGDILLNCEHEHSPGRYLILRTVLAFIATFCTALMGSRFIGGGVMSTVILFHSIVATAALCLFKSKYAIIKICAGIVTAIYLSTLAVMFDEVRYGFFIAVGNYMTKANIPWGAWGTYTSGIDRTDPQYMFYFFMALILIIAIGTSIACVYRIDFPLLFIFTFPIFEIGMYQGMEASTISVVGLFICWITVLAMHIINHTTNKAGRKNTFAVHERSRSFFFTSANAKAAFYPVFMTFVSVMTAIVFTVIILFSALTGFVRPQSFDAMRTNLHHTLTNFDITNLDEIMSDIEGGADLYGITTVGGTNGGNLGTSNGISFNGVTALKIKTGGFDYTMYLRGYVAGRYENNTWTAFPKNKGSESFTDLFEDNGLWPQDHGYMTLLSKLGEKDIQNIDITVKGACKKFVYAPYGAHYTIEENIDDDEMTPFNESYVKTKKNNTKYSFEYLNLSNVGGSGWLDKIYEIGNTPVINTTEADNALYEYESYVYNSYTEAADIDSLKAVYDEIVDTYFDGSAEGYSYDEIYRAIKYYFSDNNFTYELTPGATPRGEDFIDYFLTVQKEGYCTYYATVGTQLLRMFGYPARYVEGYMILPSQKGSSPDSEGKYEITVPDKCAHAWAEVFIDGCGWMPAEFTPGYDNDNPNLTEKEKDPDITSTTVTTTTASVTGSDNKSSTTALNNGSKNNTGTGGRSTDKTGSINAGKVTTVGSGGNSQGGVGTTKKVSAVRTDRSDKPFKIPPIVKSLLIMLLGIVAAAAAVILNRKRRLKIMNEKCTQSDVNKRVLEIFRYTMKYLSLLGISTELNLSDMQMCGVLLEKCHEKHINELDDRLTEFCEIAVKAHLSDDGITQQDAEKAEKTMKFISDEIVAPALSEFNSFFAKFIQCLY